MPAHLVPSICRVNGGLRDELTRIANHQRCDAIAHKVRPGSAKGWARMPATTSPVVKPGHHRRPGRR